MTTKQKKFLATLKEAKKALDDANIPFHLHSGTALGAIREKRFIPHDEDIDLAVFRKDWKRNLVTTMKKYGFRLTAARGTLKTGKEYQFEYKNGIPLDIFIVYESTNKMWLPSFLGICNRKPNKTCKWIMRKYKPIKIKLFDLQVYSMPRKTLVDMYGKDWKTPKKFNYIEGLEEGHYKGLE